MSLAKKIEFDSGQDAIYVYEFTDYYPRVFMVPEAEKASSEEIRRHLFEGDFDPKNKLFVEEDVDWGAKGGYAATAQFGKYTDQEVVVETQASGDGFLFLSDTYFPGWKAYVDGKESVIYRANYAFRAVKVSEGKHEVVFRYEPEVFYVAKRISLISVGATSAALMIIGCRYLWVRFRKR